MRGDPAFLLTQGVGSLRVNGGESVTQRRAVYPSAATSLSLARCSVEAQLLFTRLIAAADDQGRLQGDPLLVKAQCVPLIDKATAKAVDRWLGELEKHGMVVRYEASDQPLVQIVKWWEHQGWLRHLFPSRWPAPNGYEDRTKGHGTSADAQPDDGQPADIRPPTGRTDVDVDSDVDVEVDFDSANAADVESAIAAAIAPPPTDIFLRKVTITHHDLTGKQPNDKALDMYRDFIERWGGDLVVKAMYRVQDVRDYGFAGRVKVECKRLVA